jgi:hypothetical protein
LRVSHDEKPEDGGWRADSETYIAPAIEVLGTVEQLTRGPDPGVGDVPVDSVISF